MWEEREEGRKGWRKERKKDKEEGRNVGENRKVKGREEGRWGRKIVGEGMKVKNGMKGKRRKKVKEGGCGGTMENRAWHMRRWDMQ